MKDEGWSRYLMVRFVRLSTFRLSPSSLPGTFRKTFILHPYRTGLPENILLHYILKTF